MIIFMQPGESRDRGRWNHRYAQQKAILCDVSEFSAAKQTRTDLEPARSYRRGRWQVWQTTDSLAGGAASGGDERWTVNHEGLPWRLHAAYVFLYWWGIVRIVLFLPCDGVLQMQKLRFLLLGTQSYQRCSLSLSLSLSRLILSSFNLSFFLNPV